MPRSSRVLLFLLGTLLLGTGLARAQGDAAFGVKLGVTAAELHNEGASDPRWGPTASLFAATPLGGGFDVLGEIGYHAKGSSFESSFAVEGSGGEFETIGVDNRFDYGFVLVAPQYKDALGTSGLQLFAFAGPRLDVFLGESVSLSADPPDPGTSFFGDRDFRAFVFGAAAGIGLDLARIAPVPLTVELRYNHDFTHAYSAFRGDFEIRNRTFDLRLGLSL
jgi:hypothetical protein